MDVTQREPGGRCQGWGGEGEPGVLLVIDTTLLCELIRQVITAPEVALPYSKRNFRKGDGSRQARLSGRLPNPERGVASVAQGRGQQFTYAHSPGGASLP